MRSICRRPLAVGAAIVATALAACAPKAEAPKADSQVARGQYLVSIIGCGDCHTPGGLSPKPDLKRLLAGSDSDFDMGALGVFVPPNLTPDKATGLGGWTRDQIVTAITTGVRPDGRILSPAMPWADFSHLSKDDALAIAAYLKSIPAVVNKVPGPSAPRHTAGAAVETITPRS